MKENKRKCVKCGSSPADDPETTLYRFPKPGTNNISRCELWAKYCYPDKPWSSASFLAQLYSEHRMLCNRHFKESDFIDFSLKKLRRFASPDVEEVTMPFLADSHTTRAYPSQPLLDSTNVLVTSQKNFECLPGPSGISRPSRLIDTCVDVGSSGISGVPGPSGAPGSLCIPGPSSALGSSDVPGSLGVPGPSNVPRPFGKSGQLSTSDDVMPDQKAYFKCKKYLGKIHQLKKSVKYFKNKNYLLSINNHESVKKLANKISPTFALLLQSQIKNFKSPIKGRRWTSEDKIIALRMYKRSPTCYRLLRRMFCLPSPTTLKTLLKKCYLKVGINDEILKILKKQMSQHEHVDNEFILMFDEMSIRKHLDYKINDDLIEGFQDHGTQGRTSQPVSYALVFMIAGIRKKIKQPIAYFLSGASVTADRLMVLIKEVLGKCQDNGINIAATVCDMDGVNIRALGILGATSSKPYFEINNKEIVTLFDPPHLIKCFRNLFLKYNIDCNPDITSADGNKGKGLARWSHIQQFYELDNANNNFVFAPGLKPEHLNPNTKQKMKVKLAVQVLSHTVAAGIFAKISQGELTSDAVVTADVISKMDKIFDILNSDTTDLRRGKPFSTNLKASSPHIQFMREMKQFFQKMKFVGCARTPPSQEGWLWTLNAVERLWETLSKRHNSLKSLATRRLQQDPLENLFGCIRSNCGSNCNPTSGQFVAGFKTAILSNLSHFGSGTNCENDDYNVILDNYKMFLEQKKDVNVDVEAEVITPPSVWPSDITFDFTFDECGGETQACTYVCGYIIKKIKPNNCKQCMAVFTTTERTLMHTFVQYKEYTDNKESLIYANKNFVLCIEECASIVNNYLENNAYKVNLLKEITTILKEIVNFDFLNTCPSHKEININNLIKTVALLIIKRFCVIKNRSFAQDATTSALKKKIAILKHQ